MALAIKSTQKNYPKDSNNAGKKTLIAAIESVGREWHNLFLEGLVQHPRFIITNMSQPGGGQLRNPQGEFLSFSLSDGLQANIQYFRSNHGGVANPDSAFDFIVSNNATSPLHNHIKNAPDDFAAADTLQLIQSFFFSPEIREIHLDPQAIETIKKDASVDLLDPTYSGKIIVRGELTTNAGSDDIDNDLNGLVDEGEETNYGTRRDLDSTFLIVASVPDSTVVIDESLPQDSGTHILVLNPQSEYQSISFSTNLEAAETVTVNFSSTDFEIYLDAGGNTEITSGQTFRLNDGSHQFWLKTLNASTDPDLVDIDFVTKDHADTVVGNTTNWTADVIEIDIDIDSDNAGGPGPATNPTDRKNEDEIEETSAKTLVVNDQNGTDSVPGFADGFNLDGQANNDDDQDDTPGNFFVPIEIKVIGPFTYSEAVVKITYDHSFPNQIAFPKNPAGDYILPSGRLRLWRQDASAQRDIRPVNFNEGDFVPSGEYRLDKLDPSFAASGTLTLYLETVKSAADTLDPNVNLSSNFLSTNKELDMIKFELDPDGFSGPISYIASDKVKVDALAVELSVSLNKIPTNNVDKDHGRHR